MAPSADARGGGLMRVPGAGRLRRVARGLVGAIRCRSSRGIVLLYHRIAGPRFDPLLLDVSPANFDVQLAVLRAEAAVLALDEFETLRRRGALPERAVAVTFDDGYADNLGAAAPLLARHGVPATIFITTGMIGSSREFWWDDLERIVASDTMLSAQVPIAGVSWEAEREVAPLRAPWTLETRGEEPRRARLYLALFAVIRGMTSTERDVAMTKLRHWASLPDVARETHRALTEAELSELARRPGIGIGAHTVTHPVLSLLPETEQVRELGESRRRAEALTGRAVISAAYPFGTVHDVSEATLRAARAAGVGYAMANEPGSAWRWSNPWRIPRHLVRDWDATGFRHRLAAWWREA